MKKVNENQLNLLKEIAIVNFDFDIWSGQTRLDRQHDIKLGSGGELPPEEIATLGTKRICDRDLLKVFHKLAVRTRRFCLAHGLPFMNGYAIPAEKIQTLTSFMDEMMLEFNQEKSAFLSVYDSSISDWANTNPDYAHNIMAGKRPVEEIEKKFSFDYQIFNIHGFDDKSESSLNNRVGKLGEDMIDELISESNTYYEKTLHNKTYVSKRSLASLTRVADKLEGLCFLNNKLDPLHKLLSKAIKGFAVHKESVDANNRNWIVGPFYHELSSIILILSSRDKVDKYLQDQSQMSPDDDSDSDQASSVDSPTMNDNGITDDLEDFFSQYEKEDEVGKTGDEQDSAYF